MLPVREGHKGMATLRSSRHQGHGSAAQPRRQPGHAGDHAHAHRPGYVQGQQHAAVGRRHSVEGQVEGGIQGVHHLGHRLPRTRAAHAVPALVSDQGGQQGDRMDAGSHQPLAVDQLCRDLGGGLRHGCQQADAGHGSQVADHGRQRHVAIQQGGPHLALGQPMRRHGLARQVVVTDQAGDLGDRAGALGALESPDGAQGLVGVRLVAYSRPALGDPVEDGVVRLVHGHRVGQAQQVAVAPAVAALVLDGLVSQLAGRHGLVPGGDGAPRPAAPAPQAVHVGGEVEQVRADAGDLRQGVEGSLARRLVAQRGGDGQSQQGRVVLGSTAGDADLDDTRHGPQAVLSDAAHDRLGVLAAQGLLGGVVAAALAAQDQKAIQACPVVHSPGKAARAVWRLARPRDRETLRRLFAVDDSIQIVGHRALLR